MPRFARLRALGFLGRNRSENRPIDEVRADINVTPLVDVCLVLLIIFMVVTPMLQRGVEVNLPKARETKSERDTGERVVVSLRSDRRVFLEQAEVTLKELPAYLKKGLHLHPGQQILVKADTALTYGDVRRVMEACNEAGATQVSLATEELK
jgi:biopolymer transport protein TolR